ncbi:MAG: class I SAM-dependent methyltransferase [Pseudomonadota bacterium]
MIAALLTYHFKLARWWLFIQFFFPPSLFLMHGLHLPPVIFLCLFVVFLGLFWTTFRYQVPFYPSGLPAWEVVSTRLPKHGPYRFIDIGSGFGGLVLYLARRYPESFFSGIELAPLPWFVSWLRAAYRRDQTRFIRGDYFDLDFSQYEVVFAYLSPAAMPALWQKAKAEMTTGSLLISYEFSIVGAAPNFVLESKRGGTKIYGWKF